MARINPKDALLCLGHDEAIHEHDGAMMPPLVQTSLFAKPSVAALIEGLGQEHRHHVYTRGQNPTVEVLEKKLASLERGEACKCFASGMAAVSAVLTGLLESGDHVLFVNQIYGPTLQLAAHLARFGIQHDRILEPNPEAVARAIRPNTRLIYVESPGTMLFRMVDLAQLTSLARERNIRTAMDNTWATPLFQKPIEQGVDLVIHSCTKYIGGHSDVVAGAVIGPEALMTKLFYNAFLLFGGALAPFDAWLLIRGLRTLPTRMVRHHQDGLKVARFLEAHPAVRRVFHPLVRGEDRALAEKQLTGCSGLFSFELDTDRHEPVWAFIDRLKLFRIGISWGGVESLAVTPNRGTNQAALEKLGIPAGTVRLSVGLEGPDSLIEDLDRALKGFP